MRTASVLAGAAIATLAVPAPASAQGGLLGSIGQIVTGTTDQVTSTLDGLLGGGTQGLPGDVLGDVLVTVTSPPGAPGAPGAPGGSGSSSGSGDARVVASGPAGGSPTGVGGHAPSAGDTRAPLASVRVVSRLAAVARSRRLRVEVRSDEPGVVAFSSTIRPGAKRRGVPKGTAHKRNVIHVPPVVLAFRAPGTITVDLKLAAKDAARLGRSKNGRMSIGLLSADVARNQATERLKRHLRR